MTGHVREQLGAYVLGALAGASTKPSGRIFRAARNAPPSTRAWLSCPPC
jgi:hypothetical protein